MLSSENNLATPCSEECALCIKFQAETRYRHHGPGDQRTRAPERCASAVSQPVLGLQLRWTWPERKTDLGEGSLGQHHQTADPGFFHKHQDGQA